MESLNISFWLGIAAAIPLSVFSNLLTPIIQRTLAKRSRTRATRRSEQIRAELEEIERITSEPGRIQIFLLESVLLITLLTSGFGVISGVLFTFSRMFLSSIFAPAGQLVAVIGGIIIMKECIDVLRKSRRARNVENYKSQVLVELSQLSPCSDD